MVVKAHSIQGWISSPHLEYRGLSELTRFGAISPCASHFNRQRYQFRNVLNKVEGLAELPCLQKPGFRLLAELARETGQVAYQTDQELARGADSADAHVSAFEHVEQLIEKTSDLQDRLQRQLALVAQWQDYADELQCEFELLVGQRQIMSHGIPFDGVRALARRVISELLYDVSPPALHPQLAMEVLTERLASRSQAQVFAIALASAQIAARVARVTWLNSDHVELVTAAALLQDCGKLVVQSKWDAQAAEGLSAPLHRHAQIGRAIMGQYRNAPQGLGVLVAQHHQRLGTTPSSEQAFSKVSETSRLLAAASRFERLRLTVADRCTLVSSPELADHFAMATLSQEAVAGNWDRSFVRKMLIQRDGYHADTHSTKSPSPSRTNSRSLELVHS